MDTLLQLLIQYWKPIVGLLFAIVGIVAAIIRKKPVSTIVDDIYMFSIQAINYVENSGITGSDQKLSAAIQSVVYDLLKKYPTLDTDRYLKIIAAVIESILSTPHKKGD